MARLLLFCSLVIGHWDLVIGHLRNYILRKPTPERVIRWRANRLFPGDFDARRDVDFGVIRDIERVVVACVVCVCMALGCFCLAELAFWPHPNRLLWGTPPSSAEPPLVFHVLVIAASVAFGI